MTIDEKFRVFGSVADPDRGGDVGDIDLVKPWFSDDDRRSDILASLGDYEKLAAATGKPGEWLFFHPRVMTFRELVDEVARTAGQPKLDKVAKEQRLDELYERYYNKRPSRR